MLYLEPLYDEISSQLEELGRTSWLESELTTWLDQLEGEKQRRVGGASRESPVCHRAIWRSCENYGNGETARQRTATFLRVEYYAMI